jgi:hypothetical protein
MLTLAHMDVPGKNIDHARHPATTMMKMGNGTEGSWPLPKAFAATAIPERLPCLSAEGSVITTA